MDIKINGRSIESSIPLVDYDLHEMNYDLELVNSIESESIKQSTEGFTDALKSFGSKIVNAVKWIIDKLKRIKDWFVGLIKKLIVIIKNIINKLFHKKIQVEAFDEDNSESSEDASDDKYSKKKIKIVFTMAGLMGKKRTCKVSFSEFKEFEVNTTDFPKYIPLNQYDKIINEFNQEFTSIATSNEESVNDFTKHAIENLKKYKDILFIKNATEKDKFDSLKQYALNLGSVADEEKIAKKAEELADLIENMMGDLTSFLSEANKVSNSSQLTQEQKQHLSEKVDKYQKCLKVVNILFSMIANYNSARTRIFIELTKIIERESAIISDGGSISNGLAINDPNIKLRRSSDDTYAIQISETKIYRGMAENAGINWNSFKDVAQNIENAYRERKNIVKDNSFKHKMIDFLDKLAKLSPKLKMFLGNKITDDSNFTLYYLTFKNISNDCVSFTCNLLIDNRKSVNLSGISVLYHISEQAFNKIIPCPANTTERTATAGAKLRIYATKQPAFRNGCLLSTEGLIAFLVQRGLVPSFYTELQQNGGDIYAAIVKMISKSGYFHLYKIPVDNVIKNGGKIYADPEHSGLMQKIVSKNIRDNVVYIESNQSIGCEEIDWHKLFDENKVKQLLEQKYKQLERLYPKIVAQKKLNGGDIKTMKKYYDRGY